MNTRRTACTQIAFDFGQSLLPRIFVGQTTLKMAHKQRPIGPW